MDQYTDLIVNGLDLLSFLLVTPEILRRMRPVIGKLAASFVNTIASLLLASIQVLLAYVVAWIIWLVAERWFGPVSDAEFLAMLVITFAVILFSDMVYMLIPRLPQRQTEAAATVAQWASRKAFLFGLALFMASRVIALVAAARRANLLH